MKNYELVTSHVGIIKNWKTYAGTDVLYPAYTTEEGKERGGCFPTIPVFGEVPKTPAWRDVILPKHGLIRQVSVDYPVVSNHDEALSHRTYAMDFPARESYPWSFRVSNRIAIMQTGLGLDYWSTVVRGSKCKTEARMPLSLGLHPYFPTDGQAWEVIHYGRTLINSQAEVNPSVSFDLKYDVLVLIVGRASYQLTLRNYDRVTVWSDQPEKYICVEPNWGKRHDITLEPGSGRSVGCTIELIPKRS